MRLRYLPLLMWSQSIIFTPVYLLSSVITNLLDDPYTSLPAQLATSLAYRAVSNALGFELPLILLLYSLSAGRAIFLAPFQLTQWLHLGTWGFEVLAKVCYDERLTIPEISRFCAVCWLGAMCTLNVVRTSLGIWECGVEWEWLVVRNGIWEALLLGYWVCVKAYGGGMMLQTFHLWMARALGWIFLVEEDEDEDFNIL